MAGIVSRVYFPNVPVECKPHELSVFLCVPDERKGDRWTRRAKSFQESIAARGLLEQQFGFLHLVSLAQVWRRFYPWLTVSERSAWSRPVPLPFNCIFRCLVLFRCSSPTICPFDRMASCTYTASKHSTADA